MLCWCTRLGGWGALSVTSSPTPTLATRYIHSYSQRFLALLNPDQDRPLGYRRPVSGPGPDAESERWDLAPDPYHSDKQDPDTDPHQSDK